MDVHKEQRREEEGETMEGGATAEEAEEEAVEAERTEMGATAEEEESGTKHSRFSYLSAGGKETETLRPPHETQRRRHHQGFLRIHREP